MLDRPWRPPDRHWPDRPDVVAGLDELAGGSWLGVNDHGVVAGILNRMGSLGPQAGKRSRGELVLDALDHADAGAAAEALVDLDGEAYRPFNLVVADASEAFWLRHQGDEPIRFEAIPDGLSMVTAHDMNSLSSARIRNYMKLFNSSPAPDPDREEWSSWEELMASREGAKEPAGEGAMCIVTDLGFGTVNASLIALPGVERPDKTPIWRFANGAPGDVSFGIIEA